MWNRDALKFICSGGVSGPEDWSLITVWSVSSLFLFTGLGLPLTMMSKMPQLFSKQGVWSPCIFRDQVRDGQLRLASITFYSKETRWVNWFTLHGNCWLYLTSLEEAQSRYLITVCQSCSLWDYNIGTLGFRWICCSSHSLLLRAVQYNFPQTGSNGAPLYGCRL